MKIRYTSWDGSQEVHLDPEAVFDRLAEHLSATDDVSEALDRLLREGLDGDSFQVVGADQLADEVRRAIQELYDRYNLDRSLERPWSDLEDVVAMEEDAASRLEEAAERRRRRQELDDLPRILEEAVSAMAARPFGDEDARRAFEELSERSDDISRVDRFQRRFREQFRGPESLDFDATLEMIDRFERLREVEKALREGDLDALDGDALSSLLGGAFAENAARLRQVMRVLVDAGYVTSKGGKAVLSAKGARRLGRLALREILAELLPDASGRHDTRRRGPSDRQTEDARPYEYGDPMNIDVAATLRAALARGASSTIRSTTSCTARGVSAPDDNAGAGEGSPRRVVLDPRDLHVKETRRATRTSTVLLLDMSWSMSWEGRFAAAKKVALALETLMRTRFPRDWFGMVGFYTRAVELRPADLAEVTWNMGDPFTNLQDGLRLATRLLDRHPAATRQMIVITDGQPTAYFDEGRLFCEWPMSAGGISSRATIETLKEVERVTRKGIRINTFMLDDSPTLRSFVQRMTTINRGRAFYTTPDQLGRFVLVDQVGRKKRIL